MILIAKFWSLSIVARFSVDSKVSIWEIPGNKVHSRMAKHTAVTNASKQVYGIFGKLLGVVWEAVH
jgi:hypothetical protein